MSKVLTQLQRQFRPLKMGYHKYSRYEKPRQEISRILKYTIFFVNFIFWACGVVCIGLGIYLYANDFRPVYEAIDFFLNPSLLLIVAGCIIFCIAFLGCTGALRENVCMLKLFALSLFFAYICLVILAFVVFILFYSDAKTGVSIQTVLQTAVKKYHDNKNMAELMDTVQMQLGCCGATPLGYKDWNDNSLFNCSTANTSPERCAVPYSCCKRNAASEVPNIMCGFNAQEKSISEIQNVIHTDGCLHPLQKSFEGHAVIIGAVIGAIIVPVCLSVTFSNILAKQIERQRYLLAKEARKEQRRRRRNRSKFRDPFGENGGGNDVVVRQDETCVKISNRDHPPPLPPANNPLTSKKRNSSAEFPSGYSSSSSVDMPTNGGDQRPEVFQQGVGAFVRKRDFKEKSTSQQQNGRPSREMRKRRKIRERAASAGVEPNNNPSVKEAKKRRKRRTKSQDAKILQQQQQQLSTAENHAELQKPIVTAESEKVERIQNENSETHKN